MLAPFSRWKLPTVLLVALALGVLLFRQTSFMNGPWYWKWDWRLIKPCPYQPAMLLAALPLGAAIFVHGATRRRAACAMAMVMLSMLAMQIVHVATTVGINRVIYYVESPMNTSYFSDAVKTLDEPLIALLTGYPDHMQKDFDMHSREKAPGPVLFFRAILGIFGLSDRTALIAGLLIGVLATLTIPATYALIRVLLGDRDAAFAGCAWLALCPGLTLHFPMLDQVYPIIACLMLIAWVLALRTQKLGWAVAFGVILAAGCFIVYQFLVLGAFLAIATAAFVVPSPRQRLEKAASLSVAAIATFALLYFLTYALTGFNAVAVFRTALSNQAELLAPLNRHLPETILFDLTDFALGAGWLPMLVAIIALFNTQIDRTHRRWGLLCIGQIVIVALTGLLQAETARVWCFMLPLLMLPAAMELSRWPRGARLAIFAAAWGLLCLVGQNMIFIK